jgi:hypothetical protein
MLTEALRRSPNCGACSHTPTGPPNFFKPGRVARMASRIARCARLRRFGGGTLSRAAGRRAAMQSPFSVKRVRIGASSILAVSPFANGARAIPCRRGVGNAGRSVISPAHDYVSSVAPSRSPLPTSW